MTQLLPNATLDSWMRGLIFHLRSGEPDLTNRQMAIMLLIHSEPSPYSVGDLAGHLQLPGARISRSLEMLSALGLVTRDRDPLKRRTVRVKITPKGMAFVDTFHMIISNEAGTGRR